MSDRTRTTKPDASTRTEEARDARIAAHADREPTAEEARAGESNEPVDPEVAEHYDEMAKRGAHQEGEGRIG